MGRVRIAVLIHSLEVGCLQSVTARSGVFAPWSPNALDRPVQAVAASFQASPVLSMPIITLAR
jgi:hypothetical protein